MRPGRGVGAETGPSLRAATFDTRNGRLLHFAAVASKGPDRPMGVGTVAFELPSGPWAGHPARVDPPDGDHDQKPAHERSRVSVPTISQLVRHGRKPKIEK